MRQIQQLLSDWKTGPASGREEPFLAIQLLDGVEKILDGKGNERVPRTTWLDFLDTTHTSGYLQALHSPDDRNRWAELTFLILQKIRYSFHDMMIQRVAGHPNRVLFKDMTPAVPVEWTYEQIFRYIQEIATVFYSAVKGEPRVALFTENCLEGACADLACLTYRIFDTPLSTHFNADILAAIFDSLKINIVLADTPERIRLLQEILKKTRLKFLIYSLQPGNSGIPYLPEECKMLPLEGMESRLAEHLKAPVSRVATTMFTSGSTGLPKGVSFSIYNIISKRFARAAALPFAGEETFVCYLPLYHTFGRYLEMTGSIFWNGTYIFAGNTSAETLFSLFPRQDPTGFISVPLRWQELFEKCREKIRSVSGRDLQLQAIREIVGQRLRWGLSAAGYLDPGVFRFFNQYGINLCSGFGMTEATGGITMTPAGKYRDNSVGIPLPGIYLRLSDESELQIRGHYVGKYLEDAGPGDNIPYPVSGDKDPWMPTGDVFRASHDGYYQIVDRIKDIYKNNRGQTVAPQIVEKKFLNVPGIKRTFVVGDNRPYNVLLIVPDREEPLCGAISEGNLREYYHQIVMAANAGIAPYERVVNFTVLDRDFSKEKGELTPKGSYNRKTIEKNFVRIIDSLYVSNIIHLRNANVSVQIPRWFFRDLGILEDDIVFQGNRLFNRLNKKRLTLKKCRNDRVRVGDLIYRIHSGKVDLGIFSRQPALWIGNPELIGFCPVKEGWDVTTPVAEEIINFAETVRHEECNIPMPKGIRNPEIGKVHSLVCASLFGSKEESLKAIHKIGDLFNEVEPHLSAVMRRRVEALAFHPEEEIRTLAYRVILMKAPDPLEVTALPTFIESGLSFLNEESIREIASGNFGKHRLDALKKRLYGYRTHLHWPAGKKTRQQFESILQMLYNFGRQHMEFYVSIRAELSRWILHKKDPWLSKIAGQYFDRLAGEFENFIRQKFSRHPLDEWKAMLMFETGISIAERNRILRIFQSARFLEESIYLAFNEYDFSLDDIPPGGIWVLRLQAFKAFHHYRISINTRSGKHFELHMVLSENPDFRPSPETFYWLASLASFPYGPAVAPFLGSSRPALGALTTQYIGGLTAWDKIREIAGIHRSAGYVRPNAWRKLFIKSFAVIFRAWHHSGYQIVPGVITPSNIVIPEMDFRESAIILTLTGYTKYSDTLSLIQPMVQDFYCKTAALYPWIKKQLDISWIFDACIEGLGAEEASSFLEKLRKDLEKKPVLCYEDGNLASDLADYLEKKKQEHYIPLALFDAIDQYGEWLRMNPGTRPAAREQTMSELLELYKLQAHPDRERYYFYRHTYFSNARPEVRKAFDSLLARLMGDPKVMPIQLLELSELQSTIQDADDKSIFARMVFPRLHGEQHFDIMKIGEMQKEHVVVRFAFQDKLGRGYTLREPLEPREIGQLYQLFFRENFPREVSPSDHFFVAADENETLIGGLTWHYLDASEVLIDGIVVTSSLQGNGIASAMIENYFTSMAARGIHLVKAHFLLGNYYLKHLFEVDEKWGALIKTLNP